MEEKQVLSDVSEHEFLEELLNRKKELHDDFKSQDTELTDELIEVFDCIVEEKILLERLLATVLNRFGEVEFDLENDLIDHDIVKEKLKFIHLEDGKKLKLFMV